MIDKELFKLIGGNKKYIFTAVLTQVIWLGFAMLGLLSAKFPITISRMKKFYGALNFLRNANRLLLSENAIILA